MSQGRSFSVDFLVKFLFSRRAGAIIKIIAWLSMAGIGIGVASLIIVLSVMNGFNKSMREKRFSAEPHLVVYFDKKGVEEIKQTPGYKWLTQQKDLRLDLSESQDVLVRTTDGFVQGAVAQGVSRQTLFYIINENRKSKNQRPKPKEEIDLKPGQILMGAALGDVIGAFEGDELVIFSPETLLGPREAIPSLEKTVIKNFVRTEIEEIDMVKIYYIAGESLLRLQHSASMERTIEVRLPDPENFSGIKKKIESYGLRADSWRDRNSNLYYSLKLEKFVVGLLLGLSTIIASFSLVTVMALLITQKKKDIGLLMALGFESQRLMKVFLKIGVMLAGMGIGGGLILGLTASFYIGRYSHGILPKIYEDTNIPTDIQSAQVVMVVLIAFVFSLFTTWISVRKLAKMEPIQALR